MKNVLAMFGAILLLAGANEPQAAEYFGAKDSVVIQASGCNSSDNVPIPGTPNLFIGRQFYKRDGSLTTIDEACGKDQDIQEAIKANRWGMTLERLDWQTKTFTVVKPLLRPMTQITGGPIRGAAVNVAYDASIVNYHGQYLVAFECTIQKGGAFKIDGTSGCMGRYDPASQTILPNSLYVVVSGVHTGPVFHSVSVPQLLVFRNRLFLYWSEVTVNGRQFERVGVRGAELEPDGQGQFWVKGERRMAHSLDPSTVEVWGPEPGSPAANSAVDIKSVWVHDNEVVALAGLGSGGCVAPSGKQPGCFRMAIATAPQPLGNHIFNHSQMLHADNLPTNPQGYTRPIRTPDGSYALLGLFFKPAKNGMSELRPIPALEAGTKPAQIVMFPFPDRNLWPTE